MNDPKKLCDPSPPASPPAPPPVIVIPGQIQGQGQLQGQLQGQAEYQTAVQSLKSCNDNSNDNGNINTNGNTNYDTNNLANTDNNTNNNTDNNTNNNTNSDSNSLSNSLSNTVENHVNSTVDNHVNVSVNVDVDASSLSHPVIDLHGLYNIHDSLIMPDVVNQTLNGGGNQFNIDQVNNLVDNDHLHDPSVNFTATGGGLDCWGDPIGGGSFSMDAHIHGGTASAGNLGSLDHASSGVNADASVAQSAFNQSITMGANIQFNSQTITAGHDNFTDDHHTG